MNARSGPDFASVWSTVVLLTVLQCHIANEVFVFIRLYYRNSFKKELLIWNIVVQLVEVTNIQAIALSFLR
ncbi:MAG: hypothetical protein MUP09_04100, partial [Thiovulaceae bacterium]|nr:hypothetical protein [Sulfurimonadaceae bacterium]